MSEAATDYSRRLREQHREGWSRVTGHRFAEELFAGTLDDAVLVRYLVQDYQFFDPFLRLLGQAVTIAPTTAARLRLSRQLGMLATDENGYFQRAFDLLGVPGADRTGPPLTAATLELADVMEQAIESRSWTRVLTTLVVLEWIYLAWAEESGLAERTRRLEHRDWIDLHRGDDFRDWVGFLRRELDAAEPEDPGEAAACSALFGRAVAAEAGFFDAAYRAESQTSANA